MSLENQVISVIQKNRDKKLNITPESKLIEDLGIDSFDKLMIIAGLEDEFAITIDEEDFRDIVVVSDIIKKLEKHLA